ncbi:hypothetical protein ANCDUO_02085 [Ancylostoma duodenale]|uniref:Uncharacterized protein n=1 Tax=Ancylostoma duodenale TaxID=51022 RepID=A0A0C2DXB7_9BILA|nr:hypothetical protein ANCDUO_02085 [Ancylostoma duodenale]
MEGQEREQGEMYEELKTSRQKSRSQPSGLDRVKSLTRKLSAKSRNERRIVLKVDDASEICIKILEEDVLQQP